MSAGKNYNKNSGLRILWIPGRKKQHHKGTYSSTNKGYQPPGHQNRRIEPWTMGGSRGQNELIKAEIPSACSDMPNVSNLLPATYTIGGAALAASTSSPPPPEIPPGTGDHDEITSTSGPQPPLATSNNFEPLHEDANANGDILLKNDIKQDDLKSPEHGFNEGNNTATLLLRDKKTGNGICHSPDLDTIENFSDGDNNIKKSSTDLTDAISYQTNNKKKNKHKNKKRKNKNKDENHEEQEEKVVKCLYYTMMCCECTIS